MSDDPFVRQFRGQSACRAQCVRCTDIRGVCGGRCRIERGRGPGVAAVLALGRLPPSDVDVPTTYTIRKAAVFWHWHRDFASQSTRSRLACSVAGNCVCEQIGQVRISFRPVVGADELRLDITRPSVFGRPCPCWLLPKSRAVERQDKGGRFYFDISADALLLGCLIRYLGWLVPDAGR